MKNNSFYFTHSTDFNQFKKILKTNYIYASYYLPKNSSRFCGPNISKYVFTNIYVNNLPLRDDDKFGIGPIIFIIDPLILKYRICYLNFGWLGDIYKNKTIILNDNIDYAIKYLQTNYKYPYVLTNETLFKKRISLKFFIGIVCKPELEEKIKKYLKKYNYAHVQIFHKLPILHLKNYMYFHNRMNK